MFARHPDAVLSIAHTAELRHALAPVLRAAAQRRIAYREVDTEELARMAQSVHHEGVCMLVQPRSPTTLKALLDAPAGRGVLLALDGVQNPHNIGAILRSAAYFGARGLIYTAADAASSKPAAAALSPAARRVAEGGAEYVEVLRVPALAPVLEDARRAGFRVVGGGVRASTSLSEFSWPERSVLVLGHEQHGLTREVAERCEFSVRIAGSDQLESLNVSVAAGVFLASYAAAQPTTAAAHGGAARGARGNSGGTRA
jgi:TrmH RNA methyltransferase